MWFFTIVNTTKKNFKKLLNMTKMIRYAGEILINRESRNILNKTQIS